MTFPYIPYSKLLISLSNNPAEVNNMQREAGEIRIILIKIPQIALPLPVECSSVEPSQEIGFNNSRLPQ